ncbi:IPT/TIG domain-containing protein [Pseudoscourfieldia marina]
MIGNAPGVACTNVEITTSPSQPTGPSTLTCDAPAGSGVNDPIALTLTNDGRTLTNAGQGTAANIFTYSGPVITAVTRAATQGSPFNITGNGFGPATTTGVSGLANAIALTNIQVVSDTLITASMPTAGIGGPYPITVTVNGQQSASVNLFYYADPVVSSISVAPSVFGGTFTITGQNFGAPGTTAVVQITYGGLTETATGPTVASHTSIVATVTCPTLCHTSASDVLVTISGKTSGTSGNGKLSYAGLVVTSVVDISMFASDTNVDPLDHHGNERGKRDAGSRRADLRES